MRSLRSLSLPFDPEDELGPFGPVIREYFPDTEDQDDDRDGGDFDGDEYGPFYDVWKLAA